jgi:hypothetical protein
MIQGDPINLKSGRKVKKNYPWAKGIKVGSKIMFHPYCITDEYKEAQKKEDGN